MGYSITYLKGAVDDLTAIAAHYGAINEALTQKLNAVLENAETKLLRNPFSFSRVDHRNFRRILLERFPYKMIYQVNQDEIKIIAVLHQAASKKAIRKRLRR